MLPLAEEPMEMTGEPRAERAELISAERPILAANYPKLDLTAKQREAIGLKTRGRIEASLAALEGRRAKWQKWNNAYENIRPPKDEPWVGCANVHIPMTSYHVDGITTRLNRVMFGISPMLLCEPLPLEELPENDPAVWQAMSKEALRVETWMENVLRKEVDLPAVGRMANLEVTKEGNAPLAIHWTEFRRRKGYLEQDSETGETIIGDREEMEREGPEIILVNNEDFVLYPAEAISIEEAIGVARRLRVRWDDLRRKAAAGIYEGIERVLPEPLRAEGASQLSLEMQAQQQGDIEGVAATERVELEDMEFELWEGIWRYAWRDGFERDCLFTIEAKTGALIQAEFFPYFHGRRYFVSERILPRPNRYHGQSIPEKIEYLNEEIDTIHNQRLDARTLAINAPFQIRELSTVAEQDIKFAPGVMFLVSNIDQDMKQLEVKEPSPSAFQEERDILDYAERVTGLSDWGAGVSPEGRRRTLGEIESILSEAGLRFDDMIKAAQQIVPEIATQIWELYGQFAPHKRPPANGWKPLWTAQGDSVNASRQAQVVKAQAVYDKLIMERNPLTVTNPRNVYAVTAEWLRRMDWKDVEGAIGKEDEADNAFAQMQAMQEEEASPAAEGGGALSGGRQIPTGEGPELEYSLGEEM